MPHLSFPSHHNPHFPPQLITAQFAVPSVRAVVAVPVKNEADRLEACLAALATQRHCGVRAGEPHKFGVLLLLNNCSDEGAAIATRFRPRLPYPLQISTVTLPGHLSSAGYARRHAMDAAAAWLSATTSEDGLLDESFLLTTDADTRVAADWVDRHFRHFRNGIDAVAGLVRHDPIEHRRLPRALRERGRLEKRYTDLLTELESILAPLPWDPWPRHSMASGASIGLRLSWYRRIGGLPLRPSGEDRALLDCLDASGARIRHCPKTIVTTSCRLVGRADGGMAEAMRKRIADPDSLCDETLLPLRLAIRRFSLRGAERRSNSPSAPVTLPPLPFTGHRLRPSDLPREIERAEQVLLTLRLRPGSSIPNGTIPAGSGHRAGIRVDAASAPA